MSNKNSNTKHSPKVLAYFLPQYHAIPENDEWWGEGFTEWTTIRRENKVSENLVPLNDNYYNLLDEKTVQWQTDLAKEYGVYGFVYYHYYFCGKKLLEKPAENLLKNTHIDQKFCFCWANHSWKRTWEGSQTILQEQTYGTEKDWKEHFDYLLPFFKDDRYIKIDGKPVFVIYANFEEIEKMCAFFNESACNNEFNGIFFVQSVRDNRFNIDEYKSSTLNAITLREHNVSLWNMRDKKYFTRGVKKLQKILGLLPNSPEKIKAYNGNALSKEIVLVAKKYCKRVRKLRKKCFLGACSGWDNTSRHGINGYKIADFSDKNYIWYLKKLREIAEKENIEFIFFNAWNEWAEGMVLEPDIKNGYRFLEGIRQVFGAIKECQK